MNFCVESKVVVLGATGFVGSALFKHLRATHSGLVSGLHTRDLDLFSPHAPKALGEILDDQTTLIVACRAPRNWEPFKAYDHEITMIRNIARCLASSSLKKCLFLSTVSVYGDTVSQSGVTEMTPIQPSNLYGIAKFTGENLLRWAGEQTATPVTVFRLCKTFGNHPGSVDYGPNSFIRSALAEETLQLYGDGSELRDHLFIEDLLALVSRYIAADFSGTFNVVSGSSHSFCEIVDWISECTLRDLQLHEMPRTRPKVDQSYQNEAILACAPGFRFTTMKQAIEKTIKFYSEPNTIPLKGVS